MIYKLPNLEQHKSQFSCSHWIVLVAEKQETVFWPWMC